MPAGAGSVAGIEVQFEERDVVLLVMEYLKSREHITSMVALEEETGHQTEDLGKELGFLRKLVLTGDWDAALSFLTPLQTSAPDDYRRVVFAVKKQQFLEKLESKDARPELPDLVQVLKGIEPLCSGAEFKELCFFLTLSDIREHGDYRAWTAAKGRYAAFQSMLTVLHPLYRAAAPDRKEAGKTEAKTRLLLLLERAVLQQARTVTERNGQPALASAGLDGEGKAHTITLPLLHDVTAHDISADLVVSVHSNGSGVGSALSERPRAVHASLDLSKSQRLPDMRELSKNATLGQRKEAAKIDGDTGNTAAAPAPTSPSKVVKGPGASSGMPKSPEKAVREDPSVQGGDAAGKEAVSWHAEAVGTTLTPPYAAKLAGRDDTSVEPDDAEEQAQFVAAALQAVGQGEVGPSKGNEQQDCPQDRSGGLDGDTALVMAEEPGIAGCDDDGDADQLEGAPEQDRHPTHQSDSARESADDKTELELEPVRKPVAWTIGFDDAGEDFAVPESRGRTASGLNSSRASRDMPVLSASRRRPASSGSSALEESGGGGRGGSSLAACRRAGGMGESNGASKSVSTVGRDGDSFGKTVKITHEFEKDGGLVVSGDSEEDAQGGGQAPGKTVPKALAWVAGMDAAPVQPKARPSSSRTSLRSSASSSASTTSSVKGGAGGLKASQTRASGAHADSGGLGGKEEVLRRSREMDDGGGGRKGARRPLSGKVGNQASSPRSYTANSRDRIRSPSKSLPNGRQDDAREDGREGDNGATTGDGIYDRVYIDDSEPRSPQSSCAPQDNRSLGCVHASPDRNNDRYQHARHSRYAGDGDREETPSQKPVSAGALASAYASEHLVPGAPGLGGAAGVVPMALQAVDVLQDTQVIRTVAWCPDGRSGLLAYGTTSRALRFADASEERGVRVVYEVAEYHSGSVYAVAWHSRGRLVATGSNDKMVQITRVAQSDTGLVSHTAPLVLQGHNGTVRCVAWCERVGATHLVTGGAGDCLLRLWDGESSQCLFSLSGHHDHLQAMCTANDAPLVATGGKDGQVMLWDLRQQHCVTNFASRGDEVLSCALNPSDTMLAAGFSDSSCVMWETRMGKQVKTLSHHQHQCRSVEYTPDGRWLITASFDGTIAYVDVVDGHVEAVLSGHTDRVVQARAHPTQPWMISCSVDKTVRLWV